MRSKLMFCVILGLASAAHAKQPKPFQMGKLLQMDSVPCGMPEKDAATSAGTSLGADSNRKQTQDVLCQEYVLQGERVNYRIRARDEKRAVILPVGEPAQFRLEKNRMLLTVDDLDGIAREYVVVSMSPRSDSSSAETVPVRLNHLQ